MKVSILPDERHDDMHSVKMESDELREGHLQTPQWIAEMCMPMKDLRDLCDALSVYLVEREALESGTSTHDDVTGGYDSGRHNH